MESRNIRGIIVAIFNHDDITGLYFIILYYFLYYYRFDTDTCRYLYHDIWNLADNLHRCGAIDRVV